jgi:hypothetical protein
MACIAPSEAVERQIASNFGQVAEKIIATYYLRYVGRPAFFPLPPSIDFMDISEGFGNTALYIAYLKTHNSQLSVSELKNLSDQGQLKVPDLMTHASDRNEYYEIKPNSGDGRSDGLRKMANIDSFIAAYSLPFRAGYRWSPNERHRLFTGSLFGIEVEVLLHFFRSRSGLILYEICVESRSTLSAAEIALIAYVVVLAVIAAALLGTSAVVGGLILI